jgi:aminoglycoside phosphotransferase (APT) family kinase protein
VTTSLDIEQTDDLLAYLRSTGRLAAHEPARAQVLAGGVSNRTVLLSRGGEPAWVLKQALPKLRVAVEWFSRPERIQREALGLRWLERLLPPGAVPRFVFEDHDHHLLAMEAVPLPHDNWKTLLLEGRLDQSHVEQCARLLAGIHREAAARQAELAPLFASREFFESLRLEPYYGYTASQVPEAANFLHALVADTRACQITLTHGDFSPKNLLLRNGQLVLLDHEVIHWGHPAFDVGFLLTHLLSKAHHLERLRAAFGEAARRFWQTYRVALGPEPWTDALEQPAVRHTLGCLLARVAGRSPLEYLSPAQRAAQREAVVRVLAAAPRSIDDLSRLFLSCLASNN